MWPGRLAPPQKLASWLKKEEVEMAVMESTGIYLRTVYDVLEEEELKILVVNAQHVKKVPGRKTDVSDSQWLAELSRCGIILYFQHQTDELFISDSLV